MKKGFLIMLAAILLLTLSCSRNPGVSMDFPNSNASDTTLHVNETQNLMNETSIPSPVENASGQEAESVTPPVNDMENETAQKQVEIINASGNDNNTEQQADLTPPADDGDSSAYNTGKSTSNYVSVKSSHDTGTSADLSKCNYYREISDGNDIKINVDGTKILFSIVDFKLDDPDYSYTLYSIDKSDTWDIHDWGKIQVNDDKTIEFPARSIVDIELDNGQKVSAVLVRGAFNQLNLCIDTNEKLDIEFCDKLSDEAEKETCFGNLGSLYGKSYCDKIDDQNYQADCIYGAEDNNQNV